MKSRKLCGSGLISISDIVVNPTLRCRRAGPRRCLGNHLFSLFRKKISHLQRRQFFEPRSLGRVERAVRNLIGSAGLPCGDEVGYHERCV